MKHLTKLIIMVFIISLSSAVYSQTIGIEGGLNLSTQIIEDNDGTYSDDFDNLTGFHAGIIADFPLSEMLSFETGAILSTKGFKIEEVVEIFDEMIETKGKVNLYYIDVPLTAKVNIGTDMLNFYGKIGPYIGVGISGTTENEFDFLGQTETEEEDISWGSDEDDHYKRLDYGLTAGLGVEYMPLRLGISYDLGLANISPVTDNDAKITNMVLRISVAYFF